MKARLILALLLLAAALLPALSEAQGEALNQRPIASFEYTPEQPALRQLVTFTSTATDPDGNITNQTWDFGDGTTAYGPVVEHKFLEAGTYVITLGVTDDVGATSQLGRSIDFVSAPLPTWLFWFMPLLVSVLLFGLAYMVLLKGQPNIYNRVFFLLYTTSALKSLSEALAVMVGDPESKIHEALLVANSVAAFVLAPLFLWLVLVFPRPVIPWLREGNRGVVVLLLAVPFLAMQFVGGLGLGRVNIFNVYASIVALVALGLLIYHSWETDSEEERRRIRLLSASFFLLVFSTLLITALNIVYTHAVNTGNAASAEHQLLVLVVVALVVSPLLEIVGATLLMYAILRYQLLGIDKFVVRITRTGLTAILAPMIFVTLGNSLEEVLQDSVLKGVKAAFLVSGFAAALLMIPIQKLITFFLHRYFPGWEAKDAEAMAKRRMEIYEAQLRYCLLDGALTPKEVDIMRRLAASLEIQDTELRNVIKKFPKSRVPHFEPAPLLEGLPTQAPAAPKAPAQASRAPGREV